MPTNTDPPGSSGPPNPPPEPGAPIPFPQGADPDPSGEVDEELASLPPPKRRRSPIVAAAIIVIAGVILVALRADLRYALSPREPLALGDAPSVNLDSLREDRLVSITGQPDYRNALLFEPKGDRFRRAFFRLLGTHNRIWVRAEQTSTRSTLGGPIVGRLRHFDSLPYGEQVRAYYAEQVKTTRLLDLHELHHVLTTPHPAAPLPTVHDLAGEPVDAQEGGEVRVVVDFPDELLVSLSRDKFAVAEDARHELERLGQPVGPEYTTREAKDEFLFPVRILSATVPSIPPSNPLAQGPVAPTPEAARNQYIGKLEEKDFGFKLRREPFVTTLAGLREVMDAGGDRHALSIPSAPSQPPIFDVDGGQLKPRAPSERVEIPWARIDSIQLSSPIRIPPNAWVVVEAEQPGDFTWTPVLAGVLALFALFNVWLLIQSVRRR